jgi:hypothetical protein
MALLDHKNTATTKKLDFKNSHLTSVGATKLALAAIVECVVGLEFLDLPVARLINHSPQRPSTRSVHHGALPPFTNGL